VVAAGVDVAAAGGGAAGGAVVVDWNAGVV
jgi:hypothetical protein